MPSLDELKAKFVEIFGVGLEVLTVTVDPISDSSTFVFRMGLNRMPTLDGKKLEAALALAKESSMDLYIHPEDTDGLYVELRKEPISLAL